MSEQIETVHAREFDVRQNYVRGKLRKFRQSVFTGSYAQNLVVPLTEQGLVALAGIFLVLYDEYAPLGVIVGHRSQSNLPAVQRISKGARCAVMLQFQFNSPAISSSDQ